MFKPGDVLIKADQLLSDSERAQLIRELEDGLQPTFKAIYVVSIDARDDRVEHALHFVRVRDVEGNFHTFHENHLRLVYSPIGRSRE